MEEPKGDQRPHQRVEESPPGAGVVTDSRTESPAQEASQRRSFQRDERPAVGEPSDRPATPSASASATANRQQQQQSPGLAKKASSKASVYPSRLSNVSRDAFGPKLESQEGSLSASHTTIFPGSEDGEFDKSIDYPGVSPTTSTILAPITKSCDDFPVDYEYDTLFFRDGRRRIDMILVYREENEGVMTELEARHREQRHVFEQNLLKEGLQLELESKENSFDGKTYFLKLHIPWKVKVQYAELMNLKLPTKRFITISVKAWDEENAKSKAKSWKRWMHWVERIRCIHLWDTSKYPEEPSFYASTDSGDREERFVVKDRDTAYTPAQRSLIVMQILLRAKYDEVHEKAGIRRLLADGTYIDCFSLHEGVYNKPASNGQILDRHLLYLIWARPGQWYKKQPLWLIRRYFGEKVALYFAWLGFYTRALYPPAIVGLLCFFYGLGSMEGADNIPSNEICDFKLSGNITLCPLCDKACPYTRLGDSCLFARLTYLFDNPSTVFFAIFMSFWATTFLEMWKRKQAVLAWEWDLQNGEGDEEPRPEFEASVKTFRINPVTREREPYLPVWSRTMRYVATGSIVFFMICVVLGAVLGTIIYRISLVAVFHGGGHFLKRHAKIFTSLTAAFINLIIIMILTRIYQKLARWMVNMENPRTQTEYEASFTFKIFLFEFVNFYSSLIYIAFFKGRFYVHPGDAESRSSEFYRIKTDVCDASGCLSEVCIQLAIIMIGKQVFNNFVEILSPKMWNWWRKRTHVAATKDQSRPYTSWEQDYQLQDPGRLALFDEYLEMIIQYGFVTLFVAAFPLAPLFALLNNIAEIRLDAYKMVKEARRPLAERVEDIGAWYGILKGVTYAAVVSNAFVIAYTSDFIPRSVYAFVYSPTDDLVGYIDSSLSEFNTSHYTADMRNEEEQYKAPPTCQYRGYRNGPDHKDDPYGLSPQYWHVFAARLAFVVVFEHVVFALTGIMSYVIPETPRSVATQLQRERLLAQEAKYEKGVGGREEEDEVLSVLREAGIGGCRATGPRASWARRFSKLSDGLDAHVEVPPPRHQRHNLNNKPADGSTVWEVT
ncbi:PREDICTED: anoctamin-4 [Ceratosolen solmsi marchali]|uniref:Anoctamin n=1 Tax=Ceratosolen solmsi marchali TaxID=326594 RepID=A0AAJ6VLW8_9HYME|nr:PREDICTED: anoctamin-4 [Ceratosolen solmsi marchali]